MDKTKLIKIGCQLIKKMTKDSEYCKENKSYVKDLSKYSEFVPDINLENVVLFEGKNKVADGFTGVKDDTLYITFFSSNSKKDWLFNVLFAHSEIPYNGTNKKIKVHSGYISAYRSCREEITNRLKESGKKKVFVTGHSLGGAIASICALDLKYNNPDAEVNCVSFGSPRIGNKHFASSFNKRMHDNNNIRVSYRREFTLYIPFRWMGYKHIDENLHFGTKKTMIWSFTDHWASNVIKEIYKK